MEAQSARQIGAITGGLLLLAIAYLGFISLGLPDPVAGVAWPSVRDTFALPQSAFGLVFIGLGCGYCVSGFLGGKLTQLLGLGNLLWLSSALVACSMFASGFAPTWWFFVASAVIWGAGSGGIDAGLNSFVSTHFSAKHVNWLHACYSLGATLGPLLMASVVVALGSWRLGYVLVGAVLAVMTVLFAVTRNRWNDPVQHADPNAPQQVSMRTALGEPLVWLQVLLFFFYVGFEFTVGQWSFTLLTESRQVSPELAGFLVGVYYGGIGVGRVLTGAITHRIGLDSIIRIAILMVLSGIIVFAFASGEVAYVALGVVGLGLAPIFPCLMARTPQRLGAQYAAHAVGFQVSAGMLGAALVPGLAGIVADRANLERVALFSVVLGACMMICHEVILRVPRSTVASRL